MKVVYLGQAVPFDDLMVINRIRKAEYFLTSFTTGISEKTIKGYLEKMAEIFPEQTIYFTGYQIAGINGDLAPNLVKIESVKHFQDIISKI